MPDVLIWYDVDHSPENSTRWDNGWGRQNPNGEGIVPAYDCIHDPDPDGKDQKYRTAEPRLELYDQREPNVIRQHAYWMACLGANVVILDYTNVYGGGGDVLSVAIRNCCTALLNEYAKINAETPRYFDAPKILFAINLMDKDGPSPQGTLVADEVFDMAVVPYGDLLFRFADSSDRESLPGLLVFCGLQNDWQTLGPQWDDTRFNNRFFSGYQIGAPTTESVANDDSVYRFKYHWPYWAFAEKQMYNGSRYAALYREMPNGTAEHTSGWVAVHQGDLLWDEMDHRDRSGETTLERTTWFAREKGCRYLQINRFNYPVGWYCQPQEGLSLRGSCMIEPTMELGFSVFNSACASIRSYRNNGADIPTAPLVEQIEHGDGPNGKILMIHFSCGRFPTEYALWNDSIAKTWSYLQTPSSVSAVALPVFTIVLPDDPAHPPDIAHSSRFYLQARNALGESPSTEFIVPTDVSIYPHPLPPDHVPPLHAQWRESGLFVDGYILLENRFTAQYLEVKGASTNAPAAVGVYWHNEGTPQAHWKMEADPNNDGYFGIWDWVHDRQLQVNENQCVQDADVVVASPGHRWNKVATSDGWFVLIPENCPTMCLQIRLLYHGSREPAAPLRRVAK